MLVQRLPDGDDGAIEAVRARLAGGRAPGGAARGASAPGGHPRVAGDGFDLLADVEVAYRCGCSPERARAAVSALGRRRHRRGHRERARGGDHLRVLPDPVRRRRSRSSATSRAACSSARRAGEHAVW